MSGDPVVLAADVDSVPYRAVLALAEIGPSLPDFALIGGLAVITRLGQPHRATNDVDTVSDDQDGLFDAVAEGGLDRQGNSVVLDTDLKLDVIDVSEGDPDYLPYTTHRLAFDTRGEVELHVRPRDGSPIAKVTLPVARASVLLAVKLAIGESVGRRRDLRKVGSDAFDIARLLQRFGPDALADELATIADRSFVDQIASLAARHLVDQADRTAAAIVRSSVQGVERIDADQLEVLGSGFTRRLQR